MEAIISREIGQKPGIFQMLLLLFEIRQKKHDKGYKSIIK